MASKRLPDGVPFTQMPNHVNQDSTISSDAKVLAYYIAGRPPGWRFWRDKILQDVGLSRGQYQRAVKQLESRGYVKRILSLDTSTMRKRLSFVVLPAYYSPPHPNGASRPVPVPWMAPPKPGWHVPWMYEVIDHHDPMIRTSVGQ